ncbi:hypothetical protein EAO72_07950 [Streptomyces sp. or43]|nr:hypothetical protein EAO72_07950 [Streptomyces sp. or43]
MACRGLLGPSGQAVAVTTRELPPVTTLTMHQQRGWRCVWCRAPLSVGYDIDLGEQRTRPRTGAAYSWFPRCCSDAQACAEREEGRAPQ